MLGVDAGDQLEFEKKGDEVVVRGIKKKSILDAYGSLDIELKSPLVNVREVREQYRIALYKENHSKQESAGEQPQ